MLQSHLMRSFDMAVHDSGGRYPVALELAPDLPRDLLRYDSRKDPYRALYRDRPTSSDNREDSTHTRSASLDHQTASPIASEQHQHQQQQPLGIKGKLARGLQSLFTSDDRIQHTRTRSEDAAAQAQARPASQVPATAQAQPPPAASPTQALSPSQSQAQSAQSPSLKGPFGPLAPSPFSPNHLTHTHQPAHHHAPPPFLPSPLPASPIPSISSLPPPVPPKPSSPDYYPDQHPPVPPAPLRPVVQTESSQSPNWTWDNTKNTHDMVPVSEPSPAMSRLEQWAQTLKGQHFEEEEGMLGPYETGSVVATNSPSTTYLSDMRKKVRSERSEPRTRTGETTPKSRKSKTPKHDGSPEITLHEAKEKRSSKHWRAHSLPPSEHYDTAEAARAAAISKLEAKMHMPDADRSPKASTEQKHSRHHTFDTDLTQSTASFGHLLHQNGQPLRVNMQTHPGLLPRGGAPPSHRRNNSSGTPLGDIREISEPHSMVFPGASTKAPSTKPPSPVPMTGEAASYYAQADPVAPSVHSQYRAQVETVSDANEVDPIHSVAPTRQDSGESTAHHARPSSGVLPESHRSPSASRHMSPELSRAFSTAEAEIAHSLKMLNLGQNGSPTPQGSVAQPLTPSPYNDTQGLPKQTSPQPATNGPEVTPSFHPPTLQPTPYNPQEHVAPLTPPYPPHVARTTYQPSTPSAHPQHDPQERGASPLHSSVRPDSPSTVHPLSFPALSKAHSPSAQSVVSLAPSDAAPSVATAMVPQLVQRSTFHDETLCQLLDASRLNLLGEEAKKALMRAARARVIELKDIREKTKEMEKDVTRTEPLVIKKKKHKKRSGKHLPDSDSETETVTARKANVEELLESLLEKQDVDEATKNHVCKDPGNHSRCLSPDGEIEKVAEDLYRGRVGSGSYERGPPGPPGPSGPMYPQPPYSPGYQYPYPPQPYPVYAPVQVFQHVPPMQQGHPVRPGIYPLQRGFDPNSEDELAHRAGMLSRDSQELMAEVLNVEYAGIPVKQILMEFLDRQEGVKSASIHTVPTTPDHAGNESRGMETPRNNRSPTSPRTPSPRVQSPVFPTIPQSPKTPTQPRAVSATSPQPSHKAPSTRPPTTRQSAPPSVPSAPATPRSATRSHVRAAPGGSSEAAPESVNGKGSDWVWGSEIKIRVQPPTTLSTSATPIASKPGSTRQASPASPSPAPVPTRAVPPTAPSTARSVAPSVAPTVRSNIDYTASYLFDRELPPLPPSTYAPSVPDTVKLPSDLSSAGVSRMAPPFKGMPWELVAHRLYSWALVWEDDYFVRALESISIGRPVDEFPLTVVSMMMFKRILQLRMTNTPPQPCDKLFVPPNIAEAINKAVHAKQYEDAQALLEGLWYAFGLTEPPRVIISLVRHGAVPSAWIANRYDLVTHRFATYIVCNNMPTQQHEWDGRPFMWWHPIRNAWPGYNIPDPIALTQVVKPITVPAEFTEDISLRAASIARNLLLGIRPEHDHDIPKLRKQTWTEVNRLQTKKRAGRLMIHT